MVKLLDNFIQKLILSSATTLILFCFYSSISYAATFTTIQNGAVEIQVDDGTHMYCFDQGVASSARAFWQPVMVKHYQVGGDPTDCTNGGDHLISTLNDNYDMLFGAPTALPDNNSENVMSLLETTPSRVVVQTYRDDLRDHYSKVTMYPNGYIFNHYNIGDVDANDNSILGQHNPGIAPQIFSRNATYRTHTIADTTNNNYAGFSVIPFQFLTIPNLDSAIQESGNDINGWTGSNTAPMGNIRDDTGWLLNFDYSIYRATTTTTEDRRVDYQSPDNIIPGISNGAVWDDAGEQSIFWTGFEMGSASLCGGGDGWDAGLCDADDLANGAAGSTNKYLGNFGAQFDGGTETTDRAYADKTLTSAPKYSARFVFKVVNETLANTQKVTIFQFRDDVSPIGSLELYQDSSTNLRLCTTTTTQTCSTHAISPATWYQIEYSVLVNENSDYGSRAEIWINGVSEAIDTSSTGTSLITTARIGLISSDTAENTIDFDNVAINKNEIGIIGFNPTEGTYTVQSSWNNQDLSFDLDRNGKTANGSAFKIRGWRSLSEPERLYLETTEKTDGTDYNMDLLPFSESWVYDSDSTCGASNILQLASAGDVSQSNEYLADDTNNFNFGETSSCTWGDTATDVLYFARKDRFSGLNIDLAVEGIGNPTVAWEYCSINSNISTSCDAWATLTVSETNTGASKFQKSGNFYFTTPSQWAMSTENSGIQALYYIRARVTDGSYTTYPEENKIYPDILFFQSLETISSDGQTFTLDTQDPSLTFTVTGIGANTTNNGITTSVESTPNTLPFQSLSLNEPKYMAQQLHVVTNAANGFYVYMKLDSTLQGNYPANNIDPFSATGVSWSNPISWTSPTSTTINENTAWVGANTSDTNVPGWGNASNKFGPLTDTNQIVMYSSDEVVDGSTAVVSFAIEVNIYQPADIYSGILQYTVLPVY